MQKKSRRQGLSPVLGLMDLLTPKERKLLGVAPTPNPNRGPSGYKPVITLVATQDGKSVPLMSDWPLALLKEDEGRGAWLAMVLRAQSPTRSQRAHIAKLMAEQPNG